MLKIGILIWMMLFLETHLLSASPRQAILGGTLKECEALYGKPITYPNAHGNGIAFNNDNYIILISIKHGFITLITILKKDHSNFSRSEISKFLNIESEGGSWVGPTWLDGRTRIAWSRPDGAIAIYNIQRHYLGFSVNQE